MAFADRASRATLGAECAQEAKRPPRCFPSLVDQQLHVCSLEVQRGQALAAVRDLHAVLRMVIRRDMDLHGSADGVVLGGDDLKR